MKAIYNIKIIQDDFLKHKDPFLKVEIAMCLIKEIEDSQNTINFCDQLPNW